MKRLVTILLWGTLALVGCQSADKQVGGKANPDESLVLTGPADLQGKAFDLADYAGDVVILDVWATWCGPCRDVMPHLQEIHEEFGDRGVHVVAVSTDDKGEAVVRPFIEKNGYTFRVVQTRRERSPAC